MSKSSSAGGGGIGLSGAITVLFVGLKLTGFISWSWLWVLSPLWGSIVFALGVVGLILGGSFAVALIGDVMDRRARRKRLLRGLE